MPTSRSLRALILVVILITVAVCLALYLLQICSNVDVKTDIANMPSDHVESRKNSADVSHIEGSLMTGSEVEKTTSEVDPLQKEPGSSSVEVLVTGQIITDKGERSSNDKVTLYSPSLNERYTTKSNADGYFQLNGVIAADNYQLTITPRGLFQRHCESISITLPFSQFHIQLQSRPVSTLRGHVLNLNQVPVTDFNLKIRSQNTIKWETFVTSDSIGFFELADVPVGFLTFHSTRQGIVLTIRGYELQNDQHQHLNLTVDHGPHTISGVVFDQYGEPAVGASVIINWEYLEENKRASVSRRTATKQDGSFHLPNLGPGQHELTVVDLSNGATYKQTLL